MNCPHCNKIIASEYIAKHLGQTGGQRTLNKLGKDHFKRISQLGLRARWREKSKGKLLV